MTVIGKSLDSPVSSTSARHQNVSLSDISTRFIRKPSLTRE